MRKILCVDDDLSLLLLYQEELSEEGYEVIVARNGKEALEKYDQECPDLVVLDMRMPVTDGLETLNALLGRNRQIPVILNTAYSMYRDNFMTWGAEAYVIKSSDLTELKEEIRAALRSREKTKKDKKVFEHPADKKT
jgi:CheY-like chemotaxis protein